MRTNLRRLKRATNRLAADGTHEKRCVRCTRWFPATPDHFHRKGRYLHSTCKSCGCAEAREYQKSRYVAHPRQWGEAKDAQDSPRFDATALVEAMR